MLKTNRQITPLYGSQDCREIPQTEKTLPNISSNGLGGGIFSKMISSRMFKGGAHSFETAP